MSLIKLNWKPTPKQLRQFGAIFLIGFGLIGIVKYFGVLGWLVRPDQSLGLIFIVLGLVVGAVGLTGTPIALPFYWAWLSIAFVMGNIMSRVVIAVIYYLVITPLGLIGRVVGRDRLQLKRRVVDSYWHDIALPVEPEKYQRQF